MTTQEYCCPDFASHVHDGFAQHQDGTWHIEGCCGGGCYVVNDMAYCPFCGAKLPTDEESLMTTTITPRLAAAIEEIEGETL